MSDTTETHAEHTISPRLLTALAELKELTAVARAAPSPRPEAVRVQVFLDALERPGGIASTPQGQEDAAEAAEALASSFPFPDLHDLAGEPS